MLMLPSLGRSLPCPLFRRVAFVALGAWISAGRAGAVEPLQGEASLPAPLAWQEPAPLARLFLQLPFEAPEVLRERTLEIGVRLLYSNSLLSDRNDQLTLDVHVETAQPTVWIRYGLVPGIEAQVAIPFIVDYGGVLDRPIEVVEGWFAFSNPQRKARPRNVAHFQLTRPDGSGILRDGPGSGLGDAWAALKVMVVGGAGSRGSLALRGALKLPTGKLPYGSEELDVGGSLLAGWTWTSTAVRLQLDASTAYVLGGVTVALASCVSADVGLVENIFSPYRGADITFLLAVKEALDVADRGRRRRKAPEPAVRARQR